MEQTSDPTIPMAIVGFGMLVGLIYNGLAFKPKIHELANLFKKMVQPNYPITAEDMMDARQAVLASNPVRQLEFSLTTLFHIMNMIWRRYPKHKELDDKAKEVRSIIYRTFLFQLIGAVMLFFVLLLSFS